MGNDPIWPPRRTRGAQPEPEATAPEPAPTAGQPSAAPAASAPDQHPPVDVGSAAARDDAPVVDDATPTLLQPTVAAAAPPPTAPPSSPTPPASTPAPATSARRGPSKTVWIVLILAVAVAAVAGAIAYSLRPRPAAVETVYVAAPTSAAASPTSASASPSARRSASATASPSATRSPSATPTAMTEEEATRALAALHDRDASAITPQGQWAPVLTSKWTGITDPLQVTRSGSHTFGAPDILAEHESLRRDPRNGKVVLIYGSDFGTQQTHDGKPVYVTLAIDAAGSRADAQAWCQARYPDKSGADLNNLCMPIQLNPKGS